MTEGIEFVHLLMRSGVPEIRDQYEEVNHASFGSLTGEQRLLMAILQDAAEHARGIRFPGVSNQRQRAFMRHTIDWFQNDEDWGIFSFVSVCENLKLDPDAVRGAVLGKKKKAA